MLNLNLSSVLCTCETVCDVAGEIVEIGSAVREFRVGDYVLSKTFFMVILGSFIISPNFVIKVTTLSIAQFIRYNSLWQKAGGLAEYVVVLEGETVPLPAGIPAADAAGLPLAGLTAFQALKTIGTKFDGTGTGSNILITAASGGIGTYAVQLAKLGNHHVTATCGTRNLELVRSLGADEVLDYTTPEGAAFKNSSGSKYDYIINITYDGKWSAFKPTLSSHGRVVDVASCCENYVASVTTFFARKKIATMVATMRKEELRFMVELMKDGKLKTVIDSRHPLEKAADAWEKSMSGHATGKIIVEM